MTTETASKPVNETNVTRCSALPADALARLLARYRLDVITVSPDTDIPGSFWQAPEAGLIKNRLYIRADTPVHSALHEACHFICMDEQRRRTLHTDAGGGYDEENGVCYLQLILSGFLQGYSFKQACADMDAWGYSFRLGSTLAWFEHDADDARQWLLNNSLITADNKPVWRRRGDQTTHASP